MRSLFWRIFATFWLAIVLAAGLSILFSLALNQDEWIVNRHPALKGLDATWTEHYEQQGPQAAQQLLDERRLEYHLNVQVLADNGQPLTSGMFPRRAAEFEARHGAGRYRQLPWQRLTSVYVSPQTGNSYLFIYRIPRPELAAWYRSDIFWPLLMLGIAFVVITLFSLLLTLSITRPLNRLRGAVHDLGQTTYQQNSLAQLARRRDELGLLASDFNRMGAKLQNLIVSQRQLLRDVSHELRSPLARLRIALALAERADEQERSKLWPRLIQECDRLETLISEILALARIDADPSTAETINLKAMLDKLKEDARITSPRQALAIQIQPALNVSNWPKTVERIVDNLIRNALRFNPEQHPIEISAREAANQLILNVRDHGPGIAEEHLSKLEEPFFRAPGQTSTGHGLGLTIAKKATQRLGGELNFANHPDGGFSATLHLPMTLAARHSG